MNYPNTPGVKIKEVPLLPPSVAQVATSIPVFLGFTEKSPGKEATRITSLKDYEDAFGGAYAYKYSITVPTSATNPAPSFSVLNSTDATIGTYYLYEAMQAYFGNGGGACYVISVGSFTTAVSTTAFTDAMEIVERLDEPTLILFPEAAGIAGDPATAANPVSANEKYGIVAQAALNVASNTGDKFVILDTPKDEDMLDNNVVAAYRTALGTSYLNRGASYFPHLESIYTFQFHENSEYNGVSLKTLQDNGSGDYTTAMALLKGFGRVELPPSAFMAGVYTRTDSAQGVWKAPANVSLLGVTAPVTAVSDSTQEMLNVDATSGKSINAIRTFAGLGTMVWGARTLAGNDNEWRYINVRRLFLTVEESIKKAVSQFVFENNDAKTWVKVSAMIKSYLNGIWQDGGLQGVSEKEAFFVNVGLGQTMSEIDILEGRMIVKVGIAAVRPAEFIKLEFSHFVNQ